MRARPHFISWQYDMHLIRLLIIPYLIWYWTQEVEPYQKYRWWASQGIGGLVIGIILIFNDVFMLIVDPLRTDTYLGCVVTQIVINSCLSGYFVSYFMLNAQRAIRIITYTSPSYRWKICMLPALLSVEGISSLCLLVVSIWAIFVLFYQVPPQQIWRTNTKDAFKGVVSRTTEGSLSVLGRRRETVVPFSGAFIIVGRLVKKHLTLLLFRRIRPVETRIYAFARNSFAIIAFGILVFRIVTGLKQAENGIDTRVVSRTCDDATPTHNIAILSDRLIEDRSQYTKFSLPHAQLSVSVIWPRSNQGNGSSDYSRNCDIRWFQRSNSSLAPLGINQFRLLELFICDYSGTEISTESLQDTSIREYTDLIPYYRVGVQSANMSNISSVQMPRIWLLNGDEFPLAGLAGRNWSQVGQVRLYQPPLTLLRGSHIMANANLVTRKFITSSIIKDIIFYFKSDYKRLSLYPMVESSTSPLNSSDTGIDVAVASIRPVLAPGIKSHRSQVNAYNLDSELNNPQGDECDYIEDYRSSTIVDVIGSVGGLFALLQAMHLLLFGRPLLWGLTGAKLITPFGLLGECSSRGFKRRLKEEYHATGDDGTETIRIVKFLRHFVIDFGPADLDLEQRAAATAQAEATADAQG